MYAKFYQNIPHGSSTGPVSMCMKIFITIFHTVQKIEPVSFFQNLDPGKASTNDKRHLAIHWARSCKYQRECKILHQTIVYGSRDMTSFTFSDVSSRQRLGRWQMAFCQSLGLDLVNINAYAKLHKIFHSVQEIGTVLFFQNLDLGRASTVGKWYFGKLFGLHLVNINVFVKFYQNICTVQEWRPVSFVFRNLTSAKPRPMIFFHLAIYWARGCQYQCVYQISLQYSKEFKIEGLFQFFTFWTSAKPRPMANGIW